MSPVQLVSVKEKERCAKRFYFLKEVSAFMHSPPAVPGLKISASMLKRAILRSTQQNAAFLRTEREVV